MEKDWIKVLADSIRRSSYSCNALTKCDDKLFSTNQSHGPHIFPHFAFPVLSISFFFTYLLDLVFLYLLIHCISKRMSTTNAGVQLLHRIFQNRNEQTQFMLRAVLIDMREFNWEEFQKNSWRTLIPKLLDTQITRIHNYLAKREKMTCQPNLDLFCQTNVVKNLKLFSISIFIPKKLENLLFPTNGSLFPLNCEKSLIPSNASDGRSANNPTTICSNRTEL